MDYLDLEIEFHYMIIYESNLEVPGPKMTIVKAGQIDFMKTLQVQDQL